MKFLATVLLLLSIEGKASSQCDQDAKKFCNGTDPGRGQLAKCLDDYKGQLSPACEKELKEFKAKSTQKNPCFQDLADFCADVPPEEKNLELCLLKNEAKLNATCSADFKKNKSKIIIKDVCAQDIVNNCYPTLTEPEAATTRCLIKNRTKLSGFCQKKVDKKITDMKKANPCFDEMEKHCPTQVTFVELQECMEKKLTTLTPNCKKEVQLEIEKKNANPCYTDLRKHCKKGLSPSEQHHCLGLNDKELSNACRQFRVVEAGKMTKMAELCEPDRLKLCPKAPFQNGMVLKCLKENLAKVSPACKTLLQ